MGTIRAFIAFDTPAPIKEAMSQTQSRLKEFKAEVRWEPPAKFHATIKFLGDVQDEMVPPVTRQIEMVVARFPPFNVVYCSMGVFPTKRRPRVIWIGCEDADGVIIGLKQALDTALRPHGFPVEERPFHPHITLGRVNGERGITDLLSNLESLNFTPLSARVERILLMKSRLKPQGSEYSIVTSIPLTETKHA